MGNILMNTWTLETADRCLGCDQPPAQSWSMFPELNTVISMSSVIMFAILNKSQVHTVSEARTLQSQSIFPKHVKYFNPHPSIVASGLCSYKYIVNTVPNRIPGETWIKFAHILHLTIIHRQGLSMTYMIGLSSPILRHAAGTLRLYKYFCCRIYHGNILCKPWAELQWFQAVLLQAAPQQDGGRLPRRRGAQDQTC